MDIKDQQILAPTDASENIEASGWKYRHWCNLKRTQLKITKAGINAQFHCSTEQKSVLPPFKAGEISRSVIINRILCLVLTENKVWFVTDIEFWTEISV